MLFNVESSFAGDEVHFQVEAVDIKSAYEEGKAEARRVLNVSHQFSPSVSVWAAEQAPAKNPGRKAAAFEMAETT